MCLLPVVVLMVLPSSVGKFYYHISNLRTKFDVWNVYGIMNTLGLMQK